MAMKLTLSFFSAYGFHMVFHESAHALVARGLGLRSTLHHYYADVDLGGGSPGARALIAAAGPIFSLALGSACWAAHRSWPSPYFLYGAVFGVCLFLGNLMSASFAGDFATVASLLDVGASARRAATIAGLILLPAFLYVIGGEFLPWASSGSSRWRAMIEVIAVPVILGTALVVLAFLPMPAPFVLSWIAASAFWGFAAVAVLVAVRRDDGDGGPRQTAGWRDLLAAASLSIVVRVLANGVALTP